MGNPNDFSPKVIEAVESREQWYEENVMPKIIDNYRLIHTCVKNLYDLMIKKSLLKPDPYRLDNKISSIKPIDNAQFAEGDRSTVIGVRFSEYETMLDWICTYYKFSVENLKVSEIKKILDFTNSFQWSSLTSNSTHPNTRGLGEFVIELRRGGDAITAGTVSDILTKCQKSTAELTAIFKDLADFEKEYYKYRIRKEVFMHPKFDEDKAFNSPSEEMAQIKKAFPAVFGKEPFYIQLVEDIIKEDQDPNKEEIQAALIKKLTSTKQDNKKKKEKDVNTREVLLSAIQSLCGFITPLDTIYNKLNENNQLILKESNTGFAKLLALLRKAFNIEEKPVVYEITLSEQNTNTPRKQKVNFKSFCGEIQKKISFYNSFSKPGTPTYQKFVNADEQKVLDFLNKQISDMQTIATTLKGLDTFFKNSTPPQIRSRIKGLAMELMAIKNTLINTNQYRADYISYVEEQEQMKKLGIS